MQVDRKKAARIAQETLKFIENRSYPAPSGRLVDLSSDLDRSVAGTRTYRPGEQPTLPAARGLNAQIEVANQTTLEVAQQFASAGLRVVALNFASAKHPGGGFMGGARAQEESLARSSALYACLVNNEMYGYHLARDNPMYSDYAVYSPDVPVFRDDQGTLLERHYLCSFITCPAVNAKVALQRDPSRGLEISQAMRARIDKVLSIAAAHHHTTLILGAWGCGVFGNSSEEIAQLFRDALRGKYAGYFERVMFAVTDWSPEQRFIGPFRTTFG
jgi:uncharacterized protein (TIGR02452 family)